MEIKKMEMKLEDAGKVLRVSWKNPWVTKYGMLWYSDDRREERRMGEEEIEIKMGGKEARQALDEKGFQELIP